MKQIVNRLNIEDYTHLIEYDKVSRTGLKYRLLKDYYIKTDILPSETVEMDCIKLWGDGILEIGVYYQWNGGDFIFDTDSVMRASLVHDALCNLITAGHLNKTHHKPMNDLFKRLCLEDGANRLRVKTHRRNLRRYWQWFK